MECVKLGTVGSSFIVHNILDNVARVEGIRLCGVYSRSEEKARALAEEYGCEKTYTDMDAFLADPDINTVYIATPNLIHFEQAKRALLAGKNVILEKPFTTRRVQAEELARIAKEKKLFLVEAAPTSFLPNFAILKEQLKRIGAVKLVLANYSQYSSRYGAVLRGERPPVFDMAYAGGCLMDINFYNVLLNVLLFGAPEHAEYLPNIRPGYADLSGVIVMRYDGFVSSNAAAKDTWGVCSFQIEGENGYIYVEDGSNGLKRIRVVTKDTDETFDEQPVPDRWYYEVRELTRLFLADDYDAVYARLDTTVTTVAVMEAARLRAGIRFPGDEGYGA